MGLNCECVEGGRNINVVGMDSGPILDFSAERGAVVRVFHGGYGTCYGVFTGFMGPVTGLSRGLWGLSRGCHGAYWACHGEIGRAHGSISGTSEGCTHSSP